MLVEKLFKSNTNTMTELVLVEQFGLDFSGNRLPHVYYLTATYNGKTVVLHNDGVNSAYAMDSEHNTHKVHNPYDLRKVLLSLMSEPATNEAMVKIYNAFSETTCSHCGGGMYDGFPFTDSGCVKSELCD